MILIGVGNPWRGDDGAGLAVAARAGGIAHEGDCTRLVELWSGYDEVALVDAARSGAAAGTVHRLEAGDRPLPAHLLRSSTHAFGIPDAVELGRALGRLPPTVHVYAIEGAEFAAGAGLSPPVEAAVEALARELAA